MSWNIFGKTASSLSNEKNPSNRATSNTATVGEADIRRQIQQNQGIQNQRQQQQHLQEEHERAQQHQHQRQQGATKQVQAQEQISQQQRQFVAAVQAIYDVMGRTLCAFERYAQRVKSQDFEVPRYTKKYEKHSKSVEQQTAADILEEMKAQVIVLQFSLSRYRNTPEVQQAVVRIKQWEIMYKGLDPILDAMIWNLEACIKGEPLQLPETPKASFTSEDLLEAAQHVANGSAKAERTTEKFMENPERAAKFHVDTEHPDEDMVM